MALVPGSWPERVAPPATVPYKLKFRLSVAEIDALMAAYEAGMTGRQLAEQYGLARSTVIQLLKDRGVPVRHPRVSPEDTALAVELYAQGMRQIDIAKQLGRHKGVVWHLLQRAGVLLPK